MSGLGFQTSGPDGAAPPLRQALFDFAVSQSPAVFYAGNLENGPSISIMSPNVEAVTGQEWIFEVAHFKREVDAWKIATRAQPTRRARPARPNDEWIQTA